MKDTVFLLILGIISCSTVIPITDTYYNGEYDLSQEYSEDIQAYAFRFAVIPGDTMDIEIKIKKDDPFYFNGKAYAYSYMPNDMDIQNYGGTQINHISENKYNEGDYVVYYKTFQVPEGYKYFIVYAEYDTYYPYSYIYARINLSRYKYSYIKDLGFNTNYEFDTSIFPNNIMPNNYKIFIQIPKNDDTAEIQLTTQKNYDKNNAFIVEVCEYGHSPNPPEIYYGIGAIVCRNLTNISTESLKYKYPFTSTYKDHYLYICVINQNSDLTYINTNIYKEVTPESTEPTPEPTSSPSPSPGSAEKNNFSKVLLGLLFLILI